MFIITSTVNEVTSILIGCNYPDECYVFLVNKLKIKLQKAELSKQLQSLDIGMSLQCNDTKNYGKVKITRIPTISEYSFLTVPIKST